uniref:Uncharacterized protein n=1 Tax=Romanomermis culicivorax TaxID=13658 RepID=A0A915I275_ROMCU
MIDAAVEVSMNTGFTRDQEINVDNLEIIENCDYQEEILILPPSEDFQEWDLNDFSNIIQRGIYFKTSNFKNYGFGNKDISNCLVDDGLFVTMEVFNCKL